jgi:hypothetical protein
MLARGAPPLSGLALTTYLKRQKQRESVHSRSVRSRQDLGDRGRARGRFRAPPVARSADEPDSFSSARPCSAAHAQRQARDLRPRRPRTRAWLLFHRARARRLEGLDRRRRGGVRHLALLRQGGPIRSRRNSRRARTCSAGAAPFFKKMQIVRGCDASATCWSTWSTATASSKACRRIDSSVPIMPWAAIRSPSARLGREVD